MFLKKTILLFLFTSSILAQESDTLVLYGNNNIAIKKENNKVHFYDSSGSLVKTNDLDTKKSTSYGLPKEVQKIIYDVDIPEQIEIIEGTFPTYLYNHKYTDAGVVLCSDSIFYNKIGLKTDHKEICPDDTSDADILFGGKNIFKYNQFGLLISGESKLINAYTNNGLLIARYRVNKTSKKNDTIYQYKYKNDRLIEVKKMRPNAIKATYVYRYNTKELLTEIISPTSLENYDKRRNSIQLEYNENNQIINVSKVALFRSKEYKKTYLTYQYDSQYRITQININNHSNYAGQEYKYIYDTNGNLIKITNNGELFEEYRYNNKGTLIYISNRWGEEEGHIRYN